MKVEVYTAGTHNHSDPEGAGDLIKLLLTKAGYTDDRVWRCRIDKMKHCDAKSAPIRVIGYKDFGVYIRVKPGPNDTRDHQMTLHIPDRSGYSAETLFQKLKACQKSISRSWRIEMKTQKTVEATVAPASHSIPVAVRDLEPTVAQETPPVQPPEPVSEPIPEFATLQGIVNKREKLHFVLKKVAEMDRCRTKADYVKRFQKLCGWEAHHHRAVSRALGELVKFEFIEEIWSGVAVIGYDLLPAGRLILGEKEALNGDAVVKPAEPVYDHGLMLRQFAAKAQELADVGKRLDVIEEKRAEVRAQIDVLRTQLEALDQDYDKLAAIIKGQEYPKAILQLMGIKEFPLQT